MTGCTHNLVGKAVTSALPSEHGCISEIESSFPQRGKRKCANADSARSVFSDTYNTERRKYAKRGGNYLLVMFF